MSAELTGAQLAEAREWAARLGVPEADVINQAQAAKDGGYARAARDAGAGVDRIASAGGGQMYPGGGPLAEFEPEAGG